MSALTDDVARFSLDDPEVLVAAAFACPACLHAPCHVVLEPVDAALPVASCTCATCSHAWTVGLGPHQLLRLSLDAPAALTVTWSAHASSLGIRPGGHLDV